MSKERELLKEVLVVLNSVHMDECELYEAIEELLAQPEQDPVAWLNKTGGYVIINHSRIIQTGVDNSIEKTFPIPLYTAPPKREPLSASTIEHYLLRLDSDFKWDSGFEAGVKWA